MGRLSEDYYQQATPAPQAAPTPQPAQPAAPLPASLQTPEGSLSVEEQTRRFGGPVGSLEYQKFQANRGVASYLPKSLLEAGGLELPLQADWDRMTTGEKLQNVRAASVKAAVHLVRTLPAEIAKAPVRISNTLLTAGGTLAEKAAGAEGSFLETAAQHRVPVTGIVPTYFNTYDDARKSGIGPVGAAIVTGTQAFGDATISLTLGNDFRASFRPRSRTAAGQPVMDITPIQKLVDGTKKVDSLNEYYSMPKTVAKKYGGNPSNTYWKISPSGVQGGQSEVAIVQLRKGRLRQAVDRIKGRGEQVYQGDFGPELKIHSEVLPTRRDVTPEPVQGQLPSIPPKPLKGFANKPVDDTHIANLDNIARAGGLDETLANSVMRSVTGKRSVGELTQAEYVETAQALAGMARASRVEPGGPVVNPIRQYLSPQRHFTRDIERRGGPPVYSEGYVRVEDAFQQKGIFIDGVERQLNDMYGKYAGTGFAEERRLIREATEGRTEAITGNAALNDATKKELLDIVTKRRAFYDEYGPIFGIDQDYFLENYSPRIQDIGGVYQMYKEGTDVPKEFTPFFEKKRKGALNVQVDDAMALDHIYLRAGANKLYVNPALKGVNEMIDSLEPTLRGSMRSYVQEKLGYAGRTEQYLDQAVPRLMKNLGIDAPGDVGRQAAQFAMNTTYSGALGFRVGTAVRNTFQAFNSYIRQGPKFFGAAMKKAASKEGIQELRNRGLLVRLGVPHGADLARESSIAGGLAGRYSRFTQTSLIGQSMSDAFSRAVTFWQGKMQWDDAFTRFKQGKITWEKLETDLDFRGLDAVDQNIIRKSVMAGKTDDAFNHYIREVIDETQFPFRRGASFRAGYGLAGKVGFQFMQWPIEQGHMLGRWASSGQWDKLIRWHATTTALNRTMNETFGISTEDSFGIRTIVPGLAPLVKMTSEAFQAFKQFNEGNADKVEEHKDEVLRTMNLFVPAGVQLKAFLDFKKSLDAGMIGPNDTYPVYSSSGKLLRYATFRELWQKVWGFTPTGFFEDRELTQDILNTKFTQGDAKKKALELMQSSLTPDGFDTESRSYQDAMELVKRYKIQIRDRDFEAYYIPLNRRIFEQLPKSLKQQFAPRILNQE